MPTVARRCSSCSFGRSAARTTGASSRRRCVEYNCWLYSPTVFKYSCAAFREAADRRGGCKEQSALMPRATSLCLSIRMPQLRPVFSSCCVLSSNVRRSPLYIMRVSMDASNSPDAGNVTAAKSRGCRIDCNTSSRIWNGSLQRVRSRSWI